MAKVADSHQPDPLGRVIALGAEGVYFYGKLIAYFGAIRSLISLESDRAFRSNPIGSGVGGAVA
jgi:hypothetical protein